jgi:hypothetical protein
MSDEVREEIESFRERQMDRRKRERDERLGLVEEEEVPAGRKKVKKEVEVKEEDKKKPMKFPAEGMPLSLIFFSSALLISLFDYPSPNFQATLGQNPADIRPFGGIRREGRKRRSDPCSSGCRSEFTIWRWI